MCLQATYVLTGERARYCLDITDISSKSERKEKRVSVTVGRRSGKAGESHVKGTRDDVAVTQELLLC